MKGKRATEAECVKTSLFHRYLSAAGYILGSALVARGINFGNAALLARFLGPKDYGIYAVVLSALTVTASFSNLRLDAGLMRLVPPCLIRPDAGGKSLISSTWKLAMGLGLVTSAVYLVSAGEIAGQVYGRTELTGYFRLIAIAIVFSIATQMGLATLAGLQNFRTAAGIQIASAFMQLGATLFGLHWMGLRGVLWGYVFSVMLTGLLLVAVSRARLQESGLWALDYWLWPPGLGRVVRFSTGYLLANLVTLSALWCGNTILARIRGFGDAAMFSVAYSMGMLTLFVPGYFLNPSLPFLSEAHAIGQPDEFRNLLRRNFRLSVSIATPIAVFLCVNSREILSLIYGEWFSQAWLAASFLSFAAIFWLGIAAFGLALASVERVWEAVKLNLVWLAAFLALAFLLAPVWGVTGVAFSFLASSTIAYSAYCWHGCRAFQLRDTGAAKVAATAFAAGILAVSLASLSLGTATWFIAAGAALATWGGIWTILYTEEERGSARSLLSQFNGRLRQALLREGA